MVVQVGKGGWGTANAVGRVPCGFMHMSWHIQAVWVYTINSAARGGFWAAALHTSAAAVDSWGDPPLYSCSAVFSSSD